MVAAQWGEIGVEVEIQVTPTAEFTADRTEALFEMLSAEAGGRPSPSVATPSTYYYFTKNHIFIWGHSAPKFNAVQPWVRGYAGENSLGSDDRMANLSRLWFDNEMKKEMGQ